MHFAFTVSRLSYSVKDVHSCEIHFLGSSTVFSHRVTGPFIIKSFQADICQTIKNV